MTHIHRAFTADYCRHIRLFLLRFDGQVVAMAPDYLRLEQAAWDYLADLIEAEAIEVPA
jgi:hypothetical protein